MKKENVYKSQSRPVEDLLIQTEEQRAFEVRFDEFLGSLHPKQLQVLALSLNGLKNGSILADDLGVTKQNISAIKYRILEKWEKTKSSL